MTDISTADLRRPPELQDELDRLWAMSVDERIAAMRADRLTYHQLCAWSARHPDEVPRLLTGDGDLFGGGEFEWLARYMPELADTDPAPTTAPPHSTQHGL
jgi:hypothetical protein